MDALHQVESNKCLLNIPAVNQTIDTFAQLMTTFSLCLNPSSSKPFSLDTPCQKGKKSTKTIIAETKYESTKIMYS